MKVVDFYNHDVRDSMQAVQKRLSASERKRMTVKEQYELKTEITKTLHYLDELGLYLNRGIKEDIVISVIKSEVENFLSDENISNLFALLLSDSYLEGIKTIYEKLELEAN